MMKIRNATLDDAASILDIYAPYISDTCISFETEVPSIEDFMRRMASLMNRYPYLVCEIEEKIAGYAYASRHRERAAYRYSADVSVYIATEYHRQGIGKALYTSLFAQLKEQPIYTALAGITLPNEKSIGLHKALGFSKVGIYHKVGYKQGKWLDVLWMEKPLSEYNNPNESANN